MIAIGIDVSKSKSTVAILNGDGSIRAKPFDVRHTADELQALVKCVKSTPFQLCFSDLRNEKTLLPFGTFYFL